MSDELKASRFLLITHYSSLITFLPFRRIYPQVPTPARGEARLGLAREQRADDGQPTLVQKVHGDLDAREVSEQFARLATRVDARQGVARAVRVAAQELARREVL